MVYNLLLVCKALPKLPLLSSLRGFRLSEVHISVSKSCLLVTVSAFRMALLATNTTPTTSWDVSSALKTRKRIGLSLNVSITGNLCASSSVRLYSWPSCTNMKLKTDPLLLSCLESHAYSDSWTETWTWQKPYPIGASNTQSAEHCKLLSSFHKKKSNCL